MPTAAPAQKVVVNDQLNSALVDLTTLTLGPISFVDKLITPPAVPLSVSGNFSIDVDLRPSQNLIVRITALLNQTTGLLSWTHTSLDPATMQPTNDPLAGFLPPGTEGSVSFSVIPKAASTGTQITNKATVIFDINPPMDTPVWLNTIDNTKPTSHVGSLPSTQTGPTFTVQWSGSDVGAGIQDYTIYVSDNGSAFTAWQTNTTATSATFIGVTGHTYSFYSIARDLVGNIESSKSAPETTTTVGASACATDVTSQFKIIPGGFRFNNGTQQFLQTVTLQQLTLTPIQLPLTLVLSNLSSNATLANKTGNTTCAAPIGSPYINLPTGSTSVTLQFNDPNKGPITYTPRVLMGPGTR
jgi:hypothetical protein